MLIIGSQALAAHGILPEGREPRDTDIICTFEEFQSQVEYIKSAYGMTRCVPLNGHKFHVRDGKGWNYEFEIAWPGSSAAKLLEDYRGVAPLEVLYALKMSHRYLRNSPHFLKTMRDIQHLRLFLTKGEERLVYSDWFKQREEETYVYKHPKLNVTKGEFFDDSVPYQYDHDSIHEAVALRETYRKVAGPQQIGQMVTYRERVPIPAYTLYMQDGAQVMTDKEKFFACHENTRLYGVYEEACVLALERSQIPHNFEPDPEYSFKLALMKVCTSITSGWFREYAWENYDKVVALYEEMGKDDYVARFKKHQHLLKPFKN